MNKSIFRQLFFSYSAMILVLLFILFGGLYIEFSNYLNNQAKQNILLSTSLEREQLESNLQQQFVNLKSWASLDIMDDLISQDNDLRITQTLESLKKQYHLAGHLYVLSTTMQLIAADQQIKSDLDFSTWHAAIKAQQFLIDKYIDPLTQQPVIVLWQAVYASFNKSLLLGYIAMTYPWVAIEQLHNNFGTNTHLFLYNREGKSLLNDTHFSNIPNINNLKQLQNNDSPFQAIIKKLRYSERSSIMIHELLLGNQTFFIFELPNSTKTPLTNLWRWIALTDKEQFYAPIDHIFKVGLIIVLVTFLFMLFVIFVISRKFSLPVKLLTNAVEDISLTQNFSKRISIYGKNEFAQLAISFNNMCGNLETIWQEKQRATLGLHALNQSLEEKVAERTEHLVWQAYHDNLTGLANRTLLSERLSQAISICKREANILAVLFIDLDGFKVVNDTFGHDKGDYLLIELAKRFNDIIRDPDTIARLGGDEFVILIQIHSLEDLNPPLERIMKVINQPITVDNQLLKVSPSIGVTLFPDDLSDADGLIRHADQAMYEAKQKGRNQVQFFNVLMDYEINSHYKQKARIREALQKQEFVLHYQPQINIATGEVVGAEVLIRWQHPTQGLIFPDDFLPAIEKTDLIIDLGEWVLAQTCCQLQQWNKNGIYLKLSVNIACRHIQQSNFYQNLIKTMQTYPEVDAEQLIIEITESAAISNIDDAKEILQQCHNNKIRIALDDFGTGYSSLTYLRKLPISFLKIDKSFIMDMLVNDEDKAIVESIISLADIFKQQVVAEGIESQAHIEALKTMGCSLGQGYVISKPLPENKFIDWLKNHTAIVNIS